MHTGMKVMACARAAHEANRAYCIAIGDTSQVAFTAAGLDQQTSTLKGVRAVVRGAGPRQAHESWLLDKQHAGWKYGLVKDLKNREHPCLVDYDKLSSEQRAKDDIFVAVVTAMAAAVGLTAAEYQREPAT